MSANKKINIAVAGNPNSGKTCLFNCLTGGQQVVGNYPGVTVEKVEGEAKYNGRTLHFTDLPGTYSLTAYSQDEVVARDFILDENPDVIVDVVDASNLERNLYLTAQLREMGAPMVLALNMVDIARSRGVQIDVGALSRQLGVPVVEMVAKKGTGVPELLKSVAEVVDGKLSSLEQPVSYGEDLDADLSRLADVIGSDGGLRGKYSSLWLAIKLLENDEEAVGIVKKEATDVQAILTALASVSSAIEMGHDDDPASVIASKRYVQASETVALCTKKEEHTRETLTDRIDRVVCSRALGLVFVALCMYVLFKAVFFFSDGLAWVPFWNGGFTMVTPTGAFAVIFEEWLPPLVAGMAEGPLKSLILDGVIGGIGGVMGFVPLIFVMFFFLALLEDSGYIARIAFVLDRVLVTFGLQGKSILAMIVAGGVAGGCAVPGIMATRTLREEKDRLTTMLVAPFMNCGAKMPVYMMLIAAFFAAYKGEMLWLLALLSWSVALGAAYFLRRTVIKGEQSPFVMELPPYHLPHFGNVLRSSARRCWMYMKKAGTVILGVTVILWAMMYFPRNDNSAFEQERSQAQSVLESAQVSGQTVESAQQVYDDMLMDIDIREASAQLQQSVAGRIGRSLEPVSRFAGFDWKTNIALVGGFAAKEVIVSTLATALSIGEVEPPEDLDQASESKLTWKLRQAWTPLQAFALMIFVMIYAPCIVTVAVLGRESGSWKWAVFSTVYNTALGFVFAVIIYQVGTALGIGV